ncbi:hypothetical protein [Myceligenerans xiligouense]|uniref:Excreted virulence factor EspC (Type VII ESX diderm) n=1 Tax=Myceligenerans xiligouense TaxID=253184 RepID=A0A3N4ZR44_9MICO|nr:hypothetical protein [Myceligenerans xiligouense]RPF23425.1 hypothetical protein EDD34_4112 [Myceligenerans xiligouense]
MTRADTLQVAAGLLRDAAGTLGQARDCFDVAGLPGSGAEADRLAREVTDLGQITAQAAETARAAEPPRLRIVPPDAPGRIYGQGYDGSWFDDRTEADRRAAFDREHRINNDGKDDDGKGQD